MFHRFLNRWLRRENNSKNALKNDRTGVVAVAVPPGSDLESAFFLFGSNFIEKGEGKRKGVPENIVTSWTNANACKWFSQKWNVFA